ncbi:hypothetical protein Psta_1114 [Pirellula staleyi DSM 6068]|uniref:Uncharacterized protein n=1 Tax=Pirellula staleyi (strain ATCC 27377 / DSM 6068 / ICPB 4128) TaxID=530564 RepID=D2R8X0_PIRSD|nr:hypothetical protein [Pirellula staleyi]ADB15797.1 hypothetical protein Psta_1114 [Pirellula staleyi DSM 6068]
MSTKAPRQDLPRSDDVKIRLRITCPHCWSNFATEDVHWLTEHELLRGDPMLGPDAQQRFLPTRFDVAGNAIDSSGMTCQSLACPKCHLTLPRVMIDMAPVFVSILGIPSCGKSYFLSSMTWQMRRTLPHYFAIDFSDADPASNEILNQYERQQFLNADSRAIVKLDKTEEQGYWYDAVRYGDQIVNYPRPFLFGLRPLFGHPSFENRSDVSRVLCMYDNAGESFQPGKDTSANPVTRHLARSQAMLFLFDPTQDHRFRAACVGRSSDPQMTSTRAQVYRQDTVLHEAASRVRKYTGLKHDERHNRPLIVVVTKYDAWEPLLPGLLDTPPFLPQKSGAAHALDWERVRETSAKLRHLLWQHSPELVSGAEAFAQEVVYVPVSATGCAPVTNEQGAIEGMRTGDIQPKWVEVPMLVVLARWSKGLIPYNRRT